MFREYFFARLINPYFLSSSLFATAILRALSIISGLNVLRLWTNISNASSNIGLVSSLWVLSVFLGTWNGRRTRDSLGYFLFLFDFIFPRLKSPSRLWGPQLCLWNVFGWNIWPGFKEKLRPSAEILHWGWCWECRCWFSLQQTQFWGRVWWRPGSLHRITPQTFSRGLRAGKLSYKTNTRSDQIWRVGRGIFQTFLEGVRSQIWKKVMKPNIRPEMKALRTMMMLERSL